MRGMKLFLLALSIGVAIAGLSSPVSAAEEEMMACEAFVTAPYCCYCDDEGDVGSCGVTTGDGEIMCTRHLCPSPGEDSCFVS